MGKRMDSNIPFNKSIFVKVMLALLVLVLTLLLQRHAKSLIPMIFVIPGICWLTWGGWIIYLSRASKRWPVTQGTIIENTIGGIEEMDRYYNTAYYFPVIAYRYVVDGTEYISRRITLFPSDLRIPGVSAEPLAGASDQRRRHDVIPCNETVHFCAKYPINSIVNVHYNPSSPKDGVLLVGALSRSKQHSIVFLVTGGFLMSIGMFLLYVDIWMK